MNLSATFYFSLALIYFASVADAGCGQNGCCYCGMQDGLVIKTGSKAPDCDPGYDCECGYNSNRGFYFGACVGGQSDRYSINAGAYVISGLPDGRQG